MKRRPVKRLPPGLHLPFAWLLSVGALVLVLAACGTEGSASPSTTTAHQVTASTPRRWKTYIYEQAAISVPANWKVVTDYVCPAPSGPGTLFLGPSREPGVLCQNYALAVDSVTLTPVPEGISDPELTTCSPSSVHGLTVYVGPCGSSNPAGLTWWMIPELGIEAQASESGGSWVGQGSSTVVGRVLHTLRRATSQEVIASNPVTWPTYTYGKAAISVPSSWAVRRNQNCPDTSAAGTLELGLPQVYSTCTALVAPTVGVTVSALTPNTTFVSCPRSRVNGLTVYVADCRTRHPAGVTSWIVPSLGVEVSGSGSGGTPSTALVNLVLHTLRRATPQEITNSTPLSLAITLDHTLVTAGTPIKGTAVFTNRTGSPITVDACAADGWLDVGLSNHTITYNPANPLIACTPTVQLAPGVTRTPVTVMTTYQGCTQSAPGTPEYPPCNPDGLPPLPAGTYHTVVITSGLPAGTPAPNIITVALNHDASLRG